MSFAIREDLLPQPGATIAGQYRVESLLGHGGMGAVFAASHLRTGRAIAIKWMLPQAAASKEAVQRFIAEARATARIEHPNVVHIYDFGEADGSPFLVMERLRGESLRDRLDRVGRLSPSDAIRVMLPAMRGVAEAHREGIIHRDLKPDNIFLCRGKDGTEREAKVVDFGISKLYDNDAQSNLTGTGMMMGTPAYMSPEQLNAPKDADPRYDVYALGVVFYEALAGRLPYEAEGIFQLVAQIMSADPLPIRQLASDVPADLEAAVLQAMHREADQRFATMEELIAAVEAARRRLLGSDPGLAPPASTPPPPMTGPVAAPTATLGGASKPRSIPPTAVAQPGLKQTAVLPEGQSSPSTPPTAVMPAVTPGSGLRGTAVLPPEAVGPEPDPGVVGARGTPFEAYPAPRPKRSTGKVIAIGLLALLLGAGAGGTALFLLQSKGESSTAAASAAVPTEPEPSPAPEAATPEPPAVPDAVDPPPAEPSLAVAAADEATPEASEEPEDEATDEPTDEPTEARTPRRRPRLRPQPTPTPVQPVVRPVPTPVVTPSPPSRPRTEQGANGAMILE